MLKELKKEIPYRWRQGPGGKQLAYIDARDVMDLLDDTLGSENWQDAYKEVSGNVYAGIGILVNSQWVWKWDCGAESNIEAEKGQASDAFKRAAVKWGVGRFLYSLDSKPSQKVAQKPAVTGGSTKLPKCSNPSCEFNGQMMRLVPAGVSKKTGKEYNAFYACKSVGCKSIKQL